MRILIAIVLATLIGLAAIASQGYVQDGVTVTGSHGNYTSMGPQKNCGACHWANTGRWVVQHRYTTWYLRRFCIASVRGFSGYSCTKYYSVYTTVDVHRNYTGYFIGFTQGPDSPKVQVCLACHNAASARGRKTAIDSASHVRQPYADKRSAATFWPRTTVAPLMAYSIQAGKTAKVKTWDTTVKQLPLANWGKSFNTCMDCHWPHSSGKGNYLR